MNGKKAKALRRAAKQAAAQFPDVHNMRASYQDIVRQHVTEEEVVDDNVIVGFIQGLFGKKRRTKKVEKVVHETRQTVLASGWRFIQQRLKAAIRRREAKITWNGDIVPLQNRQALREQLGVVGGAS